MNNRLDTPALLLSKPLPELLTSFLGSFGHDLQYASDFKVAHKGDIGLTVSETLLINADPAHRLHRPSIQPSLDGPLHDLMEAVPVQAQQQGGSLDRCTGFQDSNGEGLEHQSKATVFASPGNFHSFDSVLLTVDTRHSGLEYGLKLHGVQMPPEPFGPMIVESVELGGGLKSEHGINPSVGGLLAF